nr:uncharacterized protein LOC113703245 [Coffea arabica]
MVAINKIGAAMAILFCGIMLLGANVEVMAVRPGPIGPCPLYCIMVDYVTCDGKKKYPGCTNCCYDQGCTLHFEGGTSQYCTWPPEQQVGLANIMLNNMPF